MDSNIRDISSYISWNVYHALSSGTHKICTSSIKRSTTYKQTTNSKTQNNKEGAIKNE